MNAFLIVVLVILACALLAFILLAARIYYLGSRIGAFRTMFRESNKHRWMRGYARYGSRNMAWSRLISFSLRPKYLFPRANLELVGQPEHDKWSGTAHLHVADGKSHFELVMSEGDYAGLVSWIDSLPPGEAPHV